MKAQMLKMSGCKTEKEFYSKFPSEEAFMKVHGKAFKKAFMGETIGKQQPNISNYKFGQFSNDQMPKSLGYNLSGDPTDTQYDLSGNAIQGKSLQQSIQAPVKPSGGMMDKYTQGINVAGKLVSGFQKLNAEKEKLKSVTQTEELSDLALQASRTRPEEISRRYVRPEDMTTNGDELSPIYGTGTNVLGKNGLKLKKKKAASGMGVDPYSMIGDKASNIITEIGGDNAGGDIGGTIGGTVGSFFGPAGKMVGQVGGQIIGGLLDRNPHKIKEEQAETKRNIGTMSLNNGAQGIQQQYSSFMKNGGSLDGDLKTYDGGDAEPISYNPNLPDGGETVQFKGASHADGGINVSYGNNPVEVEGGEPAVKLPDSDGTNNMVVFGNLPINKKYANVLGDSNAAGKKFKTYVADLSKIENKQNKTIQNSIEKVGDIDMNTSFSQIELNSHKANILGSNMKLKEIADKKTKASMLQEAINHVADTHGIVADDFAKGKITKAKTGANINPTDYSAPKEKFPWIQAINSVVPYFRPSDAEPLDANQLSGEMYAMSNNQLEPVQAQTYHPQLDTPYDISYQDIRNENQSDYNASQRMVGNNPAALSLLNAQKYNANQKVGAEEFRANQEMKNKVYSGNRATMNDAQLKNLSIFDQQYSRQAEAKSATKATTQAALNSISSKEAQNKLENKTLQIYENMYNYRYDNQGRAINMNPAAQFNIPAVGVNQGGMTIGPDGQPMYPQWENGEFRGYKTAKSATVDEQNPKYTAPSNKYSKAKSRNGSIVRAMKNL